MNNTEKAIVNKIVESHNTKQRIVFTKEEAGYFYQSVVKAKRRV